MLRVSKAHAYGNDFLYVEESLVRDVALVPLARAARARIVIVNAEPTPYDDIADAVLRGSISEVLPLLCRVVG